MPHHHRGKGDAEPTWEPPVNPELERMSEDTKHANAGRPPPGEDEEEDGEDAY